MAAVVRVIHRGDGQPGDPCIYCQLPVSPADLTSVPCHVACEDEASLKRHLNDPSPIQRAGTRAPQSPKGCRICGKTSAESPRRVYARGFASMCISCEANPENKKRKKRGAYETR